MKHSRKLVGLSSLQEPLLKVIPYTQVIPVRWSQLKRKPISMGLIGPAGHRIMAVQTQTQLHLGSMKQLRSDPFVELGDPETRNQSHFNFDSVHCQM